MNNTRTFIGDVAQVEAFLRTLPPGSRIDIESFRRKGADKTTHVVTYSDAELENTTISWVASVCP